MSKNKSKKSNGIISKFLDYVQPQRVTNREIKKLKENNEVKTQSGKFGTLNKTTYKITKGDDKKFPVNRGTDANKKANLLKREAVIKKLKKYDGDIKTLEKKWKDSTKDFLTSDTGRYYYANAKIWESDGYKTKSKAVSKLPKTIKGRILIVEWREKLWIEQKKDIKAAIKKAMNEEENDPPKGKKGQDGRFWAETFGTIMAELDKSVIPNNQELLDVKLKF